MNSDGYSPPHGSARILNGNIDWGKKTAEEAREKCLKLCQQESGATACEVQGEGEFFRCILHSDKDIVKGSGDEDKICWILSKCSSKYFIFILREP